MIYLHKKHNDIQQNS